MKTIIKDGKRNVGTFTFKCEKCGCKFKADVADYDFIDAKGKISNNTTDVIMSECPNCGESIKRDVYTYTPLEKIKRVLTHKFEVMKTDDTRLWAILISIITLIANGVIYAFFAITYPCSVSVVVMIILWIAEFILNIIVCAGDY